MREKIKSAERGRTKKWKAQYLACERNRISRGLSQVQSNMKKAEKCLMDVRLKCHKCAGMCVFVVNTKLWGGSERRHSIRVDIVGNDDRLP